MESDNQCYVTQLAKTVYAKLSSLKSVDESNVAVTQKKVVLGEIKAQTLGLVTQPPNVTYSYQTQYLLVWLRRPGRVGRRDYQ